MFRAIRIRGNNYVCISVLLAGLLSAATSYTHSLVFVHTGPIFPTYFLYAYQQARLFNADCPIYLITDQKFLNSCQKACGKDRNFFCIATETLQRTEAHRAFLATSALQKGKPFWVYASERFFYLDEFMDQYAIQDLFHIENDIMLYVDLATLLPTLHTHYSGIAAVFDNDNRCIPGFMYMRKPAVARQLADYFAQCAAAGLNDMQVIANFKNTNNATVIDALPLIMAPYTACYGLTSRNGHTAINPAVYCNNIASFNALFDGAALGQYLGGTQQVGPGFINETCLFNPALLAYQWRADEKNRKVPFAVFAGESYRINNLHIHSKKLKKFSSLREKL